MTSFKFKFILATVCLFTLAQASAFADQTLIHWTHRDYQGLNPVAVKVMKTIDYASHNGEHAVGIYNPNVYNTQKFLKSLKAADLKEGVCKDRRYTSERGKILHYFREMAKNEKPFNDYESPAQVLKKHKLMVERMIGYKKVAHVVYNGYKYRGKDQDAQEACDYFEIYFFFKDRTVLRLEFNFTD